MSLEVGFASPGSFASTFRRHVGVTPSRYLRATAGPSSIDRIPLRWVMAWARHPVNGAIGEELRAGPG